jgi:hypothetical protein
VEQRPEHAVIREESDGEAAWAEDRRCVGEPGAAATQQPRLLFVGAQVSGREHYRFRAALAVAPAGKSAGGVEDVFAQGAWWVGQRVALQADGAEVEELEELVGQ